MKRFILLMACFVSLSVFAQRGDFSQMLEHKLERMQDKLELTDQQVDAIQPILEANAQKMIALKKQDLERSEKHQAFKRLMEQQKEELSPILTEDQMAKLAEMMHFRRGHHGHFKHDGEGEGCEGKERHCGDKEDRAAFKEIKEIVMAYAKENIFPLVHSQRQKLEPSLSQTDKNTIDELRGVFKESKEEIHSIKKECKENGTPRAECKELIEPLIEAMHDNKEQVRDLADKYSESIEALLEPIKAQAPSWKEDIKELVIAKVGEDKAEKVLHHLARRAHFMHHLHPGKFLMLDPDKEWEDHKEEWGDKEEWEGKKEWGKERQLNVYPNPSTKQNTLKYEVLEDGKVVIELYNQQGRLVQTVVNAYKTAGEHSIDVDLSGLQKDMYFYKIIDASGESTQRFMLK